MSKKILLILSVVLIFSLGPARAIFADLATGIAIGALFGSAMAENEAVSLGGCIILYQDPEGMERVKPFRLRIAWHYLSKGQMIWRAFELAVGKNVSVRSKLILVLGQVMAEDPRLIFFYTVKD